ncbi:uncharacterized protein LOC131323421 [Rhododendron vialii]|uniref:uncharacterized protein LOC131323421 n=1 Tax=Rhododendron vialii TaxID=182163 RepID=UPI00265DB98E|nr:uncharacterized protein LOC131323421 [Rhododendron vialii]
MTTGVAKWRIFSYLKTCGKLLRKACQINQKLRHKQHKSSIRRTRKKTQRHSATSNKGELTGRRANPSTKLFNPNSISTPTRQTSRSKRKKEGHSKRRCTASQTKMKVRAKQIKEEKISNKDLVIRNKELKKESAEANFMTNEPEQLFSCMNVQEESQDVWYLDSGCSNHMTGNRDIFVELDQNFASQVKLGDGKLQSAEGKGVISVRTKGALAEKQSGHEIKTLRTDRGGEFIYTPFMDYCKENGIQRQLTIRRSPQQMVLQRGKIGPLRRWLGVC